MLRLTRLRAAVCAPLYYPLRAALRVEHFSHIMTGRRFMAIKARLRFTEHVGSRYEPAVPRSDVTYDRLWKVRPLLEVVEARCRALVHPGTFVTVDEAMCFTRSKCARVVALGWPVSHRVCVFPHLLQVGTSCSTYAWRTSRHVTG